MNAARGDPGPPACLCDLHAEKSPADPSSGSACLQGEGWGLGLLAPFSSGAATLVHQLRWEQEGCGALRDALAFVAVGSLRGQYGIAGNPGRDSGNQVGIQGL